jgi:hypothetical protein
MLNNFVEKSREYQDEKDTMTQKALKDDAFGKWMAFLLM